MSKQNDGGPCLACPMEVRALYASAYNLLNLYKSEDAGRIRDKLQERMQELIDAVNMIQPHIDRHFAGHQNEIELIHPPQTPTTKGELNE